MKVYRNGYEIFLNDHDFIASGGEGSIYKKNGEVFKVFLKPISINFLKKIEELSVLNKQNILRPLYPLYNKNDSIIGFTMRFVDDTIALPLLFTTTFRERNVIIPKKTIQLVENIAEVIQYIHEKKILIVDANEFNYLVAKSEMITPYFIDVDSYQTPSFPATAILPSIKDFTQKDFNELTDWYSFGIIALQLFIGIHPYKGSHPDFKKDDIESRCKAHVSIFNNSVKIPVSVRPFDFIPSNYLNWFKSIFENGQRILPPTISGSISIKPQETVVSNKLIINLVLEFSEKIKKVKWVNGIRVIQGKYFVMFGNKKTSFDSYNSDFIYFNNNFIKVSIRDESLFINDFKTEIYAIKHFIIDNRLYIIDNENVREINFLNLREKDSAFIKNSWSILPNASVLYKNCIYSNIFGKSYFYIFYEEEKCKIIDIKLDAVRIIDASYEKETLYVMFFDKGIYNRAIYKFDKEINIVDSTIDKDISLNEINTTALNNGINLLLSDDNIYITIPLKTERKIINDVGLSDAFLTSDGSSIYFFKENKLYSMKMN